MAGIAGFAGLDDRTLLESMTSALKHRGPENPVYFHQDGVGIGGNILAGEAGAVVACDGSLDRGAIIRAYEAKNVDGLKEHLGGFSLALWDSKTRRLLLARDPLGIKPLYYSALGSKIYFGSELKALRQVQGLAWAPDLPSVEHLLDFLYIPAPKTIYAGVSKLRAGEWLLWQDGFVQRGLYWEPKPKQREVVWSKALEELDALLLQVVRDHSASDAPITLIPEAGLGSIVMSHYLAKAGRKTEPFVVAGGLKVEETLTALVEAFDEPLAESSAIQAYAMSRAAHIKVKTALTSAGADELFGGHMRYMGAKLFHWYQWVPHELRGAIAEFTASLPEHFSVRKSKGWIRRFLVHGTGTPERAYSGWMGHLSPADKDFLYSRDMQTAAHMTSAPFAAFEHEGDILQKILVVDLKTCLAEYVLTVADRTSAAVGLELRAPLCDKRLADFSLGLPSYFRVRGRTLNAMLRALMKGKVPDDVLKARRTRVSWFKPEFEPMVADAFAGLGKRGLFQADGLQRLLSEHRTGKKDRGEVLWALLFLERWLRKYHPNFKI